MDGMKSKDWLNIRALISTENDSFSTMMKPTISRFSRVFVLHGDVYCRLIIYSAASYKKILKDKAFDPPGKSLIIA